MSSSSESEDSSEETEACLNEVNDLEEQSLDDGDAENDVDDETMSGKIEIITSYTWKEIIKWKLLLGAAAHQLGNTSFRKITEVKQHRARIELGWETVQVLPDRLVLIFRSAPC